MLYDLNIAWSPTTTPSDLERTLRFAKTLGYDVVALNHTVTAPIPNTPTPIRNPLPLLNPPKPLVSPSSAPSNPSLPTTLRRVTLTITDPSTTNYRLLDYTRAYDLLALRPTTDKAFAWACSSTTEPPGLISLDLTSLLSFHIHHRTAMTAVHRGTRFEICYAQALSPNIDARARATFIGNVLSLLRATKGRGIVVSSEAKGSLELRGPADVVNLLAVWGLGPEKGAEAMGSGARAVVVNEGVKRRGFRGVVDIIKPAEEGEEAKRTRQEEVEKGKLEAKEKGKKQKGGNQAQGLGAKRKGEEGNGGASGSGTMSKRLAKKMKKDAMQAAGGA
ncbi:RNase P subunit p30-domain-containing protein [Podospora aff. communis PSN243]|uniref:RNase P subunit p30-domain-containing protein n=1 Tax=Podospora aff. communis PSN243 TaxID=3040156 RepID=A0AAV9GVM2_9PEZI|nr:RNase P subunit p30-domain-containing protein [Podospora aff. communis PSN243]